MSSHVPRPAARYIGFGRTSLHGMQEHAHAGAGRKPAARAGRARGSDSLPAAAESTCSICSPAFGAQSYPGCWGRRGRAANRTSKRKTKKRKESTRWPEVWARYF